MRLSNKLNIATGSVLLLVAAFFSISLALLPMDFGPAGPGTNNPLYIAACTLGDILFSVYGFSSILIPLFLFVAGISCFATISLAASTWKRNSLSFASWSSI